MYLEMAVGLAPLIAGTGLSRASVLRALKWLRENNWIRKVSPRRPAFQTEFPGYATVFRLTTPVLENLTDASYGAQRGLTSDERGLIGDRERSQGETYTRPLDQTTCDHHSATYVTASSVTADAVATDATSHDPRYEELRIAAVDELEAVGAPVNETMIRRRMRSITFRHPDLDEGMFVR